jgi:hypothetical protein
MSYRIVEISNMFSHMGDLDVEGDIKISREYQKFSQREYWILRSEEACAMVGTEKARNY